MASTKPVVAVLSGKGGTGKTFVAVNLAEVASPSYYLDCDVEAPNGHLFFKPVDVVTTPVKVLIPGVEQQRCTGCGRCVEFCRFNALAYAGGRLLIFEEVCHSCGGCVLVCPEQALTEREKAIGLIEQGRSGEVTTLTGVLGIGEVSGVPVIESLLAVERPEERMTLIDSPPGAACSVLESVATADYCLVVAEPTLFGLSNFKLVYELVQLLDKPFGVVINKCLTADGPLEQFCRSEQISILMRIPYEHELAQRTSAGEIVSRTDGRYRTLFTELLKSVQGELK